MKENKFEIWQLKSKCDYSWMKWSYAKQKFNPDDYKKVYEGKREHINLEALYVEFNVNHPNDFRGHSMSVSDVIFVKEDIERIYYVDSWGFEDITEEWKKRKDDGKSES